MTADATGPIRIGCAGWSLPKAFAADFPQEGSHLERYAARFNAVEINSSFYRPHRPATYARWAASVPADFRFSAKVPRTITHQHRLVDVEGLLSAFLGEVGALGERLGCLLVQLPPSLVFDASVAGAFFAMLRDRHRGSIVVEPRHPSWFETDVPAFLRANAVGRVAADPAQSRSAAEPAGDLRTAYYRWHGSPRMYYSNYDDEVLASLAERARAQSRISSEVWCIFDNTALGAATGNALALARMAQAR